MMFFLGKAIILVLIFIVLIGTGVAVYNYFTKREEPPKEDATKKEDQSEDDWSSF